MNFDSQYKTLKLLWRYVKISYNVLLKQNCEVSSNKRLNKQAWTRVQNKRTKASRCFQQALFYTLFKTSQQALSYPWITLITWIPSQCGVEGLLRYPWCGGWSLTSPLGAGVPLLSGWPSLCASLPRLWIVSRFWPPLEKVGLSLLALCYVVAGLTNSDYMYIQNAQLLVKSKSARTHLVN